MGGSELAALGGTAAAPSRWPHGGRCRAARPDSALGKYSAVRLLLCTGEKPPARCGPGPWRLRNWHDEHLFVLRQALAMYDDIAKLLRDCDAKLQGLLSALGSAKVDLGKTRAEFDTRQILANWAGVDLTRINWGCLR